MRPGKVAAEDVRADARPRRPRAHRRSVRGADEGRRRRARSKELARAIRRSAPIRRVVLTDLAEFTHFVTRVKVVPAVADDVSLSRGRARARPRSCAAQLSMRVLSRTWQMLLKGIDEVQARRPPARRRRDGAGAHRLCRRSADAGRGRCARSARRRGAPRGRKAMAARAAAPPRRASRRATRRRADRRARRAAVSPRRADEPVAEPARSAPPLAIELVRRADRARRARSATSR